MDEKQTEIERLIYDSKEYLKRNHFGEYTLLYILNKDRVKGSPYQYAAVASTDEARLFFNVYAKEDQPDIYRIGMCSTDDDLFYDLEFDDCTIAAMTMEGHFETWEELADTPLEEITYLGGLETYLEYCRENNITKESIQEAVGLEVCDIMERLDKNKSIPLLGMDEEYQQLQKVVDTILNGTDERDLRLAQDMLNGIWSIDQKEPVLKRTDLQQAACDICILVRDHMPEVWAEKLQSGDTEAVLAKEIYGRLATLYGRKTEAQFLRKAEMGDLPETVRKKISEILAVLKKYENKDKKPPSGHSR